MCAQGPGFGKGASESWVGLPVGLPAVWPSGRDGAVALLRYWAGARAAAGVTEQSVDAATLAEALDAARSGRGERFAQVLGVCSFVVDEQPVGLTPHGEVKLTADSVVEVLPPFAGGAGVSELNALRPDPRWRPRWRAGAPTVRA